MVAASPKKELAQEFLNFLSTPESVEILKKYGFGQP